MLRSRIIPLATVTLCFLAAVLVTGRVEARVSINGYELSPEEVRVLERRLGALVPAGDYLVDDNGCWVNLRNDARGCLQSGSEYLSRQGSGSRSADGSWNHWSNAAGGAVGGTGDGCVYTTYGWSNC